ncbi:MAG TPA: N(4)-(beta-N-acetylglucosaminyl)-L-asparaginase [Rubricoccaceae bacterium]|nr:N(4)-(beta-N-acetylglucosaminyl)-L-asparaginase [Rubricoccaceae bacterium]
MSLTSRRAFLKKSAALSALAALPAPARAVSHEERPVVVATWSNHGAIAAAWEILRAGGHALDAVEAGARVAEADPRDTSVGLGGLPDRDGRVTLDACIMDERHRCGSVAFLEHILHPISVARKVMEQTPHIMLVGEGALRFALEQGFERTNLLTEESEREWRAWLETSGYTPPAGPDHHDTIGIVGVGADGRLSGACSTSGRAYKMRGRVGDSPIIGAGLFVDDAVGAATATGTGEEVIRISGSHLVVERMRAGDDPETACRVAVERIVEKSPRDLTDVQVGFLTLRKDGAVGGYALRPGFVYTLQTPEGAARVIEAPAHFR